MSLYKSRLVRGFRYWRAHRTATPLMAQALYEPLTDDENALLSRLFSEFPELAEEFHALERFSKALRLPEDNWQGDLLPAIREKLATPQPAARGLRLRPATYALALSILLLASAGFYTIFMLNDPQQLESGAPVMASNLSHVQEEACDLVARGEAEYAAELLEQALLDHPDDVHHANALLTLADIEYTYLQRYERAYDLFKWLERDHQEVFDRNWDHNKRARLLAAALPDAFEPLRELENAARADAPLPIYESILAQYPEKVWADEAMHSMRRIIARATDTDPAETLQILQLLRDACTHPVARERIDLELGDYYCDQFNDLELARMHYTQAASSRNLALAARGREALARLD